MKKRADSNPPRDPGLSLPKEPGLSLPKGAMASALALVILGGTWLLLHTPQPTGLIRESNAVSAPGKNAAATRVAETANTHRPDTAKQGGGAASEPVMALPNVDLTMPVDPALAAEVSHALEAHKALYEPAGSLSWDQAKALNAKREQTTKELLERLARLGPGGARALAAGLSHTDSLRAKLLLVQALGKVNDPEAAGVLQTLLQPQPDQSFSMRKEIVVALGQRRDVASEQALAGLLTQQSDAQLRFASAQGLAGRENALPVLAERLRVESIQDVRLELMRSVGLIRNPAAMDVLADVAQTKGELICRKTAIQELGRSFGASALPVLGRVLNDPDEAIRKSAVAAMARVRTDEVVAILQRTAETDASALVSGAAAAALASMRSAP